MLGEIVQELRAEHGWSRPQLAEQSGVSVPTISRLELYDTIPGVDLLAQLAEALGTTPGALLTEAEDRAKKESVSPARETARRAKARK